MRTWITKLAEEFPYFVLGLYRKTDVAANMYISENLHNLSTHDRLPAIFINKDFTLFENCNVHYRT